MNVAVCTRETINGYAKFCGNERSPRRWPPNGSMRRLRRGGGRAVVLPPPGSIGARRQTGAAGRGGEGSRGPSASCPARLHVGGDGMAHCSCSARPPLVASQGDDASIAFAREERGSEKENRFGGASWFSCRIQEGQLEQKVVESACSHACNAPMYRRGGATIDS